MNLPIDRSIIIRIIVEDFRCQRLQLGLEGLGFSMDYYSSDLFKLVLHLMEFTEEEQNELIYKLYYDFLEEQLMPIAYYELPHALKELSTRFYIFLLAEKRKTDSSKGRSKDGK